MIYQIIDEHNMIYKIEVNFTYVTLFCIILVFSYLHNLIYICNHSIRLTFRFGKNAFYRRLGVQLGFYRMKKLVRWDAPKQALKPFSLTSPLGIFMIRTINRFPWPPHLTGDLYWIKKTLCININRCKGVANLQK